MKKIWIVILVTLFSSSVFGQVNLVPNPSFEDTIQCPDFPQPTIDYCLHWSSYGSTSDYFNPCANFSSSNWGVPNNAAGAQVAFIGNAYAGLLTWFVNGGSPIREYMGIGLTQQLNVGTKYFVSCYISNGDSTSSNSSSNNFGFKFSTVPYTNSAQSLQVLMNNFSHVHTDSIITDKINWTRIAGAFIADSAYQYLVLGNFYDDANTAVDTLPPFGLTGSYYYIDAVCVTTDSIYDSTWTAVNELEHVMHQEVFPNPAGDEIAISNKQFAKSFMMVDMPGNVVMTGQLIDGLNKINISSIAAGMYMIFLDRRFYNKIIVQH